MAVLISSWLLTIAFLPLVAILGLYIHFRLYGSKYWAQKNVPHLKPVFFFGNMWRANLLENLIDVMAKIHLDNKKKKLIGIWAFDKPQLMVTDVELAKRILIKDFNVFRDRGFHVNTDLDPLNGHLFFLAGKTWRNLRVKLTPTFTSGKIKMMLPTIVECGIQLEKHLRKIADGRSLVEVKDLMARYTTDVIATCAFGIDTNSVENPESEFRVFGKQIVEPSIKNAVTTTLNLFFPGITKLLSVRFIPKEVTEFFINAVKDTMEYREKNKLTRNDFLQMMIQLVRAGKVEDVDKNQIDSEGLDDEALVQKFSLVEAAAQCFVFFGAGFETSSTALAFALYELAVNPDIQKNLQKEIDENTKNGISYEDIMKMEYLDMVVQEVLRKYPPAGNLQRISNADYHIPELGVTLDKGTTIIFAVKGFHYDPETFPNPDKFDPERFSEENKSQIPNGVYLPFGDGPRSCIGNRFALVQVKIGLIYTLKSCNVEVTKKTPIPVKLSALGFTPISYMPLAFSLRK